MATVTVLQASHDVELTMTDGETYRCIFEWVNEDNMTPVDLSGASAQMHILPINGSEAPVIALEDGAGLTIRGSAGAIDVSISASQTDDMAGQYVWDLRIVHFNGDVTYLFGGSVRIVQARTNVGT